MLEAFVVASSIVRFLYKDVSSIIKDKDSAIDTKKNACTADPSMVSLSAAQFVEMQNDAKGMLTLLRLQKDFKTEHTTIDR